MRAGLCARVSTTVGQNPEMQLTELRDFVARRGWIVVGEYVDVGISGGSERRPQLDAMMTAARGRTLDAIVCWKLDRFGRSLKHLVTAMADLESCGVTFIALRDNLDLSTPSGRLMFHVIGAMAEFERDLIRERVKAGVDLARARGKQLGRPRRRLDAARIVALRANGCSWRQIARELDVGVATARAALARSENVPVTPTEVSFEQRYSKSWVRWFAVAPCDKLEGRVTMRPMRRRGPTEGLVPQHRGLEGILTSIRRQKRAASLGQVRTRKTSVPSPSCKSGLGYEAIPRLRNVKADHEPKYPLRARTIYFSAPGLTTLMVISCQPWRATPWGLKPSTYA